MLKKKTKMQRSAAFPLFFDKKEKGNKKQHQNATEKNKETQKKTLRLFAKAANPFKSKDPKDGRGTKQTSSWQI